ncbi:hypothetical protein DL93DRAFT_681597 [Clavulina sp. PMI_390]|nr:hypothetical protein DL93DRAFT_681597 [Clavulina sp. PMI_390]
MDIQYLSRLLSLPPEDPRSIHPVLLNAIYAVAVCLAGPISFGYKYYFHNETRREMANALAKPDRLTHFLWACVVFGSFLAATSRINEAYTVISTCVQFANACGLSYPPSATDPDPSITNLLPPPADDDEVEDRIRLSQAIYAAERCMTLISGFPSVPRDPQQSLCEMMQGQAGIVCEMNFPVRLTHIHMESA